METIRFDRKITSYGFCLIHTGFVPDCQEVVFFTYVLPHSVPFGDEWKAAFSPCGLNILRLFDESTYTNKAYSKRGGS